MAKKKLPPARLEPGDKVVHAWDEEHTRRLGVGTVVKSDRRGKIKVVWSKEFSGREPTIHDTIGYHERKDVKKIEQGLERFEVPYMKELPLPKPTPKKPKGEFVVVGVDGLAIHVGRAFTPQELRLFCSYVRACEKSLAENGRKLPADHARLLEDTEALVAVMDVAEIAGKLGRTGLRKRYYWNVKALEASRKGGKK